MIHTNNSDNDDNDNCLCYGLRNSIINSYELIGFPSGIIL